MNKKENKVIALKDEKTDTFEDWSLNDLKKKVAELTIQNACMADDINQLQLMVETFKFTTYLGDVSNMAMQDLLIEDGVISKEKLAEKINNSEDRKRVLAEILDMDFRLYIHKKIDAMDPLKQWLYPEAVEKLNAVNW